MSHWQSKTKIRPADKKFSEYIRQRDGRCMYRFKCFGEEQEWKYLTNSHFIKRRAESVRFDPQNCDTACRSCHQYVEDTVEGKRRLESWKELQLGEREYKLLLLRGQMYRKKDDVINLLYIKELLKSLNK